MEERWISPSEKAHKTFLQALKKSIKTPFSEPSDVVIVVVVVVVVVIVIVTH